jgi:hypothetical protein
MNMVFDTPDYEGGRIEVLADSRKIRMCAFLERDVGKERLSMFRGEDHMHIDLDEGLGHG